MYWNRCSKCCAIFQHIHIRNLDICHTAGPTFVICVVEGCYQGLEPLTPISASLSFGKCWRWSYRNFMRCKKRCALRCVLVSVVLAPTCRTIFWTTGALWQFCSTKSEKSPGNDCWHSWHWISICAMLCAFKNVITDHTSQSAGAGIRASNLIRCNDASVRTREVPRHAT